MRVQFNSFGYPSVAVSCSPSGEQAAARFDFGGGGLSDDAQLAALQIGQEKSGHTIAGTFSSDLEQFEEVLSTKNSFDEIELLNGGLAAFLPFAEVSHAGDHARGAAAPEAVSAQGLVGFVFVRGR